MLCIEMVVGKQGQLPVELSFFEKSPANRASLAPHNPIAKPVPMVRANLIPDLLHPSLTLMVLTDTRNHQPLPNTAWMPSLTQLIS